MIQADSWLVIEVFDFCHVSQNVLVSFSTWEFTLLLMVLDMHIVLIFVTRFDVFLSHFSKELLTLPANYYRFIHFSIQGLFLFLLFRFTLCFILFLHRYLCFFNFLFYFWYTIFFFPFIFYCLYIFLILFISYIILIINYLINLFVFIVFIVINFFFFFFDGNPINILNHNFFLKSCICLKNLQHYRKETYF